MKSQSIIQSNLSAGSERDSFKGNLFKGFEMFTPQRCSNPEVSYVVKGFDVPSGFEQVKVKKEKAYNSQKKVRCEASCPYTMEFKQKKSSLFDEPLDSSVSDRFIPTRKYFRKESNLIELKQDEADENNVQPALDPHHFTAPQIYKRFIMSENKIQKDGLIKIFENQNLLKFNEVKKTSILSENLALSADKSEFDFTDKLIKSTSEKRKINKLPFKVLDAPALQDDFYLNLIDWGAQNFLAVGLSSNVYLWNGNNSKVTKLCDLGLSDTVTSVGWSMKGPIFSLGTNNGELHLWDLNKMKRIRTMEGHEDRIASIAWNNEIVSTGSRDKSILQRDPRSRQSFFSKLTNHKQEVCGLKWSPDGQQLCSGGNDNKLYIWNLKASEPIVRYSDHVAAVKAVTWSPHQHGLLLSGGGTADKSIKFRNTLEGTTIKSVDTGSQVCNLIFSKTLNEFVSTHGFSLNQINVWRYPKMQKISTLTGHTFRVLYLAMSPDGSTIVTGAGDETLRFWKMFPGRSEMSKPQKSILNVENINIR